MSLYGLNRDFYAYVSDDGNTYQVAITAQDATAGAFGAAQAFGANPTYPRAWKMRHVYGVSSTGVRTKVPVAQPSDALYVTQGTTFTKNSVSFTGEGIIGEKRTARA